MRYLRNKNALTKYDEYFDDIDDAQLSNNAKQGFLKTQGLLTSC